MRERPETIVAELRTEPATAAVLQRLARRPHIDAHNAAVAQLSIEIARGLGLSEERVLLVARAALLHDVGKQLVPREVLDKPGALTASEWALVRRHPQHSHRILIAAGLHEEARIALHHHERVDGLGYPGALAGDGIPLESRIIAVADSLDAMTSPRAYRPALTVEQAMAEVVGVAGTQLDRACVDALVAAPTREPLRAAA